MELKTGKSYTTRGGHEVSIESTKKGPYPFVGTVKTKWGGERQNEAWTKRGRFYGNAEMSEFDITGETNAKVSRKSSRSP